MADERIIRIRLDGRGAISDANRVNREVRGVGSSADNAGRSLLTMSRAAKAVATALAGAAIAKFFTGATVAAKNFNASISNLSAITGATGANLRFLSEAALEFGATTTLSATQAAEALKLVASAKPDLLSNAEALKEVTAQAVLLAEASGGTLALSDAAKAVGKSLNQFGAEADQAARFVNVLAAGSKLGSSEVLATSEALKEAGVSAAGANISFEETNAAIQVLAKSGIEGSQAGAALRNIFLKLETDINDNLRPSVVGLEQALKNVNDLNETGAEQVKRFGLENINAAQFILNNVDSLGRLKTSLTGTNTAFEQASTNIDNLDGDLKSLNSAFEALQIQVGSLADEDLRALTQATTEFLQALNGNEEALAKWGGVIDTAGESLEFLIKLGAAYYINNMTKAIVASTVAFTANQVQVFRYNSALAAHAGVSRVAATATWTLTYAMRALKAALPFGIILLGLEVLQNMLTATNDQIEANDRYAESTRKLNARLDTRAERERAIALRTAAEVNARNQDKLAEKRQEIEEQRLKLERSNAAELAKIRGDEYNEADKLSLFQITKVRNRITLAEDEARRLEAIANRSQAAFAKIQGEVGGEASKKSITQGVFVDDSQGAGVKETRQTNKDLDSFFSQGGVFSGSADNQDDSAFQATISREKLVTQQLQEEIAARRALLNGEINQRQLDEELALQEVYYGYEARRAAILENETITAEQRNELLATLAEQELLAEQAKLDAINSATESSLNDRQAMQEAYTQSVQALQMQTYSNATALLNSLNSESKAAALIGIGIQTATAFSANKAATASAATLAYASQLIPGDPTSIARASVAAAKATAIGNVNGALILASGAAKGFGALGGGGGGSPSTGGSSGALAESPTPRAQTASDTQSSRRVIDLRGFDNGGYLTKEQLTELLSGDDDVIIASNSGQQQGARVGLING